MKEKDIIDFTKMQVTEDDEIIDENGEEVGCKICYIHNKAYEKLSNTITYTKVPTPLCPKCGKPMDSIAYGYEEAIVSETNFSNPEGEIGYYAVFTCNECTDNNRSYNQHTYALIPTRIVYNGNHDIFYTGGKKYLNDEDHIKLKDEIFEAIAPSIEQYIRRKLNPEDMTDNYLDMRNIKLWASMDVEHVIAKWLYEHNLKK